MRVLLEFVRNEPAEWSSRTGYSAPTTVNQLITQLIQYGHGLVFRQLSPANFSEKAPVWEEHSDSISDIPIDAEHYHALLSEEARRQGVSVYDVIHAWQIEDSLELPSIKNDPLWGLVGIGASGLGDVAEHHDDYLTQSRLERKVEVLDSSEDSPD